MRIDEPQIPFLTLWDFAQRSQSWHTSAGLILDAVGGMSLFGAEHEDEAQRVGEAVMEALGDRDGSFLAAWRRRFRADPVQATADWQREVAPKLICRWMSQVSQQ